MGKTPFFWAMGQPCRDACQGRLSQRGTCAQPPRTLAIVVKEPPALSCCPPLDRATEDIRLEQRIKPFAASPRPIRARAWKCSAWYVISNGYPRWLCPVGAEFDLVSPNNLATRHRRYVEARTRCRCPFGIQFLLLCCYLIGARRRSQEADVSEISRTKTSAVPRESGCYHR